jgi:hypothetical protein
MNIGPISGKDKVKQQLNTNIKTAEFNSPFDFEIVS